MPTNPTDYFNFVVDTCWRANAPVLTKQLSEIYAQKLVDEGRPPTTGHIYWFSEHPEWLIAAWVAAGVQISDDHVVQKKMLTTLWTKKRADVLQLLQMYLPPTENFVHAAVQHIRQAMPCVGVTMDTRLFVSALATEDELRHLWKAEAGALTLAEPYGLVRQSLIKRNKALTDLQLNLKGFQFLNINI